MHQAAQTRAGLGQTRAGRGGGTHRRDLRRPRRAEGLRLGLQQFHLHGQLSDPLHGAIQFRLQRIALALLERGVDPAVAFSRHCSSRKISTAQAARGSCTGSSRKSRRTTSRLRGIAGSPSGPAGKAWPGENVDEPSSPAFTTGPSTATFFSKLSVMFRSSLDTSIKPILCPRDRVRLRSARR